MALNKSACHDVCTWDMGAGQCRVTTCADFADAATCPAGLGCSYDSELGLCYQEGVTIACERYVTASACSSAPHCSYDTLTSSCFLSSLDGPECGEYTRFGVGFCPDYCSYDQRASVCHAPLQNPPCTAFTLG